MKYAVEMVSGHIIYRVIKKGYWLQGGYSTYLNGQNSPSQHMSKIHCLMSYGRVQNLDRQIRCSAV